MAHDDPDGFAGDARTLTARDGVRIAYRVHPASERRPGRVLVLLHGLASNLTRWSEFVAATSLTDRWELIRVDLRGHGESQTRGPIGMELWCEDLAALLDAERHGAAVLAGHSFGAQVALHFAARFPARVAGLALIDPVFREAMRGRWAMLARARGLLAGGSRAVRALNAVGLRRRDIGEVDLQALDAMARESLLSSRSREAFVRRYSSVRADLEHFRTAHFLRELAEMFRPVPVPQTFRMPVLVLLSSGATFADPAASALVARRFPRGTTVTIDAYHWPLTERPVEVRLAIEAWLRQLE